MNTHMIFIERMDVDIICGVLINESMSEFRWGN